MKKNIVILCFTIVTIMSCGPSYIVGSIGSKSSADFTPITKSADLALDEGYWDLGGGIKIHYLAAGKGEPVLVIHGGPGSPGSKPWPALIPLENKYRFYYPDARGCGLSTRPITGWETQDWGANIPKMESELGLSAQIGDIERIRQILGAPSVKIIGHSFGGLEAFLYAREFPGRTQNLILISPATFLRLPTPPGADLYTAVEDKLEGPQKSAFQAWRQKFFDYGKIWTLTEENWISIAQEFIPYWNAAVQKSKPTWGGEAPPSGAQGGWIQGAVFFSLGSEFDLRPQGKFVTVPATIFYGDRDVTSPQAWQDWEKTLPQAKVKVLEGAGHFPFTDASRFTKLMDDALKLGEQ